VKGCPTPIVIGYPGPSVSTVNPISVGTIRHKTGLIGRPDIAISGIRDPVSIRAQLIIKLLIGYFSLGIVVIA
jgi:hypothetical protein